MAVSGKWESRVKIEPSDPSRQIGLKAFARASIDVWGRWGKFSPCLPTRPPASLTFVRAFAGRWEGRVKIRLAVPMRPPASLTLVRAFADRWEGGVKVRPDVPIRPPASLTSARAFAGRWEGRRATDAATGASHLGPVSRQVPATSVTSGPRATRHGCQPPRSPLGHFGQPGGITSWLARQDGRRRVFWLKAKDWCREPR